MYKPGTGTPGIGCRIRDTNSKKEINKQGGKKEQRKYGIQPEKNLLVTGFFGKEAPERMEESRNQNENSSQGAHNLP
jgi:hypothetical protein